MMTALTSSHAPPASTSTPSDSTSITILNPFLPLITSSSSSAHATRTRKAVFSYSGGASGTELVRSVRVGVDSEAEEQKASIHRILSSPSTHPDFLSLHHRSAHLLSTLKTSTSSLTTLENDLLTASELTVPVLDLLQRRDAEEEKQKESMGRLTILKKLRERVKRLESIHRRILDGKGGDPTFVKEVMEEVSLSEPVSRSGTDASKSISTGRLGALNKGKSKEVFSDLREEQERVLRGSRAWRSLNTRASHLLSLLQNLLEESFASMVRFDGGRLIIGRAGEILLSTSPSSTQSNAPAPTKTKYPLSSILLSIQTISPSQSLLPHLLKKIHTQIISNLVQRIIESGMNAGRNGGKGRLVVRVKNVGGNGEGLEGEEAESGVTELWLEQEQEGAKNSEVDGSEGTIFSCLNRLINNLQPIIKLHIPHSTDSVPNEIETALKQTISTFRTNLLESISKEVVERYFVPSMPKGPERLLEWVDILRLGVEYEKSLEENSMLENPTSSPTIIQDFYSWKASGLWVSQRRDEWFDELRELICGGWKGWDAVQVTRERRVEPEPVPMMAHVEPATKEKEPPAQSKQSNGYAKVEDSKQRADEVTEEAAADDGWSFGDEWQPEEDAEKSSTSAPASEPTLSYPLANAATPEIDMDNGWDFEESSGAAKILPPLADPEEEAPIVLKKPTRVAKRLGKAKGKGDLGTQLQQVDDSAVPVSPVEQSSAFTSVQASPVQPRPVEEESDDWAWDNAEQSAGTEAAVVQPITQPPPQPTVITETCTISTATSAIISFAEDALRVGISFPSDLLSIHEFDSLPSALHQTAREVFELYRALMPVAHKKEVEEVPSLSAQFINDCEELALQIPELEERYRWSAEGAESRLRILGEICQRKMLQSQQDGILEILDETNGFEDIADEGRYEACQRVFSQVRDKIEVLCRVWMHVMLQSTCLISVGVLVDATVDRITSDILAIRDITADDSEKLNKLCGEIKGLEELFSQMTGANVVAFVPSWLKFCYVSELLEASLADIRYLHETGALVDFTKDELVHLIQALFTDTPLRGQAIDRIMGEET